MPDDMFFANNMRSLRRGRRAAQRTPVCRPCVIWLKDMPDEGYYGVVMDINRNGMRIRMLDLLPPDSEIIIQLMKDEEYREPLARPVEGIVARVQESEGMSDHGVRIVRKEVAPIVAKPVPEVRKRPAPGRESKMYMLDVIRKRVRRRSGR